MIAFLGGSRVFSQGYVLFCQAAKISIVMTIITRKTTFMKILVSRNVKAAARALV